MHMLTSRLPALSPGLLWSTAVYEADSGFLPGDPLVSPKLVLNSKSLWRPLRQHVHTRADPFLLAVGEELFLFLEAQAAGSPGRIEAYKTADLEEWTPVGEVLREPHHVSYPAVFRAGSSYFMIPESAGAGEVALYRFEDFPGGLKKVRTLLTGEYVDTSPIEVSGLWYLFTTSRRGLEIFYTDDIETGALQPHPLNPITNDPRYRRCGGLPVRYGTQGLLRLSQDCSERYGGNLNVLKIEELSPTAYRETVWRESIFDCSSAWNALGGHHLSVAQFRGSAAVAVDGQHHDYYVHKFSGLIGGALRRLGTRGFRRYSPA